MAYFITGLIQHEIERDKFKNHHRQICMSVKTSQLNNFELRFIHTCNKKSNAPHQFIFRFEFPQDAKQRRQIKAVKTNQLNLFELRFIDICD